MSLIIHCKYKYFDSTVQRAEDRRQKFYFCLLPFAVNVKRNLSIDWIWRLRDDKQQKFPLWFFRFCVLFSKYITHKKTTPNIHLQFKYKYLHFRAQTAKTDGKSFTFAVRPVNAMLYLTDSVNNIGVREKFCWGGWT